VASDPWLPIGAVASVTVRPVLEPPGSAAERPARLRGFLRRTTGVVFETESDLDVEPVPFPEKVEVGPRTPLEAGSVAEGADGPEVWLEGFGGVRRRPLHRAGFAYGSPEAVPEGLAGSGEGTTRTVDLVMGKDAEPLGFRFGAAVDLGADVWTGPDVLKDTEIPFLALRARAEVLSRESALHRVKVGLRTASRQDRQRNPFSGEDSSSELEFWGVAVLPEVLVVLGRIEEEQIRKIESVRVQDDDATRGVDAAFVGRVKGYDAFLVRVAGANLSPLPADRPPPPAVGEALLVHRVAWRGGARRDEVGYTRVTGWARGYADRRFLSVERRVEEGAVLMDADMRVLGFSARLDPEDRESPLGETRRERGERSAFPPVAVLFSEIGLPASLAEDPDQSVMPQGETEARRMPWLGVEYDAIDPGVAEMMEVSEATWDGSRGLIVTLVYPGSPAERLGLRDGDVLLSVRRTSGPGSDAPPVDLRDRDDSFMPRGFSFGDGDAAPAPWRPAANALTRLLLSWGVGTTYELTYLRDGRVEKATIVAELGPPDFHSAPRAKDSVSGLSIRDLTYEVRTALRLAPDSQGVVVSRVEPGSPGAQARIAENELIREYQGQHVPDAKTFREWLERDRAAKLQSVRLVVQRLGKTRLVDLSLAPQDARARRTEGAEAGGGEDEEPAPPDGDGAPPDEDDGTDGD
jgi:hypothetical protein